MSKQAEPKDALFTKPYWDRPVPSPGEAGDASADPIFHAVGMALSTWESAECALATLFQVMSRAETANAHNAVRRAFGSIESSAGRRKALEAAAEVYFAPDWENPVVKKPFKGLMLAFEEGSKRRDEIAHGMAYGVTSNNNHMGSFLFPAEYNTQRTTPWMSNRDDPFAFTRAKYRYTSTMIHGLVKKFGELHGKVYEYISAIRMVNGVPAAVLDARHGDGAAKQIEALIAEQKTKAVADSGTASK